MSKEFKFLAQDGDEDPTGPSHTGKKRKTEGDSGMEKDPKKQETKSPFPWTLDKTDDDKMVVGFYFADAKDPPLHLRSRWEATVAAALWDSPFAHRMRTLTGMRPSSADFEFVNLHYVADIKKAKQRLHCLVLTNRQWMDKRESMEQPDGWPKLIFQYERTLAEDFFLSPEVKMTNSSDGDGVIRLLDGLKNGSIHQYSVSPLNEQTIVDEADFVRYTAGKEEFVKVPKKEFPRMQDLIWNLELNPTDSLPSPMTFWTGQVIKEDDPRLQGLVLKRRVVAYVRYVYLSDEYWSIGMRTVFAFVDEKAMLKQQLAVGKLILEHHPMYKRALLAKKLYDMDDPLAIRAKSNVRNLASFISSKYPSSSR